MQRKKHTYAPEISLYPSEIHAIDAIATMSTINMTELSRQLGVTKSAVTKIVAKLEKQDLIRRYKYIKNQKEIFLHLTQKGVDAYNGHKIYHAAMNKTIEQYCSGLSDEKGQEILNFLELYLSEMKKLNEPEEADQL